MIITLLSDFGTADSYVAQMKGVLLRRAPGATLVDVTHEVPPYDVIGGAQVLAEVVDAFPPGTIHIAVVDPGVGGDREPVIVSCKESFLVGPNNGLLALSAGAHYEAYRIDLPPFRFDTVSATFEGRDVFAPAAAALAKGRLAKDAGPRVSLRQVELPEPTIYDATAGARTQGSEGEVLRIDRFGNLITNLRPEHTAGAVALEVQGLEAPVARTFGDVAVGTALAYVGSSGLVEVAIRQGNASTQLGVAKGTKVRVKR